MKDPIWITRSQEIGGNMNTKKDSHSHSSPDLLKDRQAFFFDGIRYSLRMIKVANNRLQEKLYSLTNREWEKEYLTVLTASVMLDAWSIIDSVHRFRNLLMQAPGIKQKSPELRIFYDKTEGVEALRNTIQHLRNESKSFIDKNLPALGILSWVVLNMPDGKSASLYSLVAGTIYPNIVYPLVNPLGKRIQPPVDHINIILGNHSLCLSDIIEKVEGIKLWIEQTSGKHLEAEPALVIRANLTFGKKGSTQVQSDYNKIVELKPDYLDVLNNLGLAYAKLGKYNKALAEYNKALEVNQDYLDVLNNRGNTYLKLKKYNEALADYNKALELTPDLPDVLHNRGLTYAELGKYDKALTDYSKALELNPDYLAALINRGIVYKKLDKHDEALADYNKAIELKPDYFDAFNNRGNVYLHLKKYDEALADYKRALELKPDYAPVLYNLAILFVAQGKVDDAISYLEKAINEDKKLQKMAKIEKYFDNIRKDPRFKKLIGID